MSEHLTSEQIDRFVAGDAGPDQEPHERSCPLCREQIEHLRATLGVFRTSVRTWSDSQASKQELLIASAIQPSLGWRFRFRWAAATVALVSAILLPLYKTASDQRLEAQISQ